MRQTKARTIRKFAVMRFLLHADQDEGKTLNLIYRRIKKQFPNGTRATKDKLAEALA